MVGSCGKVVARILCVKRSEADVVCNVFGHIPPDLLLDVWFN